MASSWRNVALRDVVTLGKGGVWGQDDPGVGMLEAVCLRGTDLAELIDGRIPEAPRRWITESELRKAQCHHNMVLIETSGSRCGRSKVLTNEILSSFPVPVVYSNFCRTLAIDTNHLDSKYVEMWFSFQYEVGVIPSYRATSAMPNLDIKSLLRIERLALPPLQEQKRIVDLVSAVDEYIASLQRQADAARTARNAVLHELLTAGGEDWNETSLGHLITLRTGKLDVNAGVETGEFPFFTCSRETYKIDVAAYSGKSVIVAGNGDLNVKYFDGAFNAYQRTYILQAIDEAKLFPPFLFLFMEMYVETLRSDSQGSTIQYLKKAQFTEAPINLPPLDEQMRITETVFAMDNLIRVTESSITKSKDLRSGLVSDLLSGKYEIPDSYDRLLGAA